MTASTALEHILEGLEQADGHAGLQIAIEALRGEMNVDHMVYHWVEARAINTGVVHTPPNGFSDIWTKITCGSIP